MTEQLKKLVELQDQSLRSLIGDRGALELVEDIYQEKKKQYETHSIELTSMIKRSVEKDFFDSSEILELKRYDEYLKAEILKIKSELIKIQEHIDNANTAVNEAFVHVKLLNKLIVKRDMQHKKQMESREYLASDERELLRMNKIGSQYASN